MIYDVFPSVSVPGQRLNIQARHRVNYAGDGDRDMGEFIGVYVGEDQCNMFDIDQGGITYTSIAWLKCNQSPTQEAGRYTVK